MQRFARVDHVTEGWYVLARGGALKPGDVRTVEVGAREIVLYRALDGALRALDAHCAHLGAHLSRGAVVAAGLRCGYHGWCWGSDGSCVGAPGHANPPARQARAYVTEEKWGLAWVWLGDGVPGYPIPDPGAPPSWRTLTLRPQVVKCHPHLVLGNGYDIGHLAPAHGFALDDEPVVKVDGARMEMVTEGTLPSSGSMRLFGMGGKPFWSSYVTIGGSVTLVHVRGPVEFRILFTGRPDGQGHTRAQTLVFAPRRRDLARALALLWTTTLQDIRIMESLARFRPAFDAVDEVLATYAKHVDGMPTW